jgi:nicotinamidase-related amidase
MAASSFFDYGRTFVEPVPLRHTSTALLVIDVQYHDASPDHGFNVALERMDPGSMLYFNERLESTVIPAIARLSACCRSHGVAVIYLALGSAFRDLRDVPPRLRRWIRTLEREGGLEDVYWTGNPDWAIRREIEPHSGDTVIAKTTWGAFTSSTIDQVLRSGGIESLIITGVSTNCCVESTAREAADRGYACVIVDEATCDYDQASHDATLRAYHFNFGRVARSADQVIAVLDREGDF